MTRLLRMRRPAGHGTSARSPFAGRVTEIAALAILCWAFAGCQPSADSSSASTPTLGPAAAAEALRALHLAPSQVLEVAGPAVVHGSPADLVPLPELSATNRGPNVVNFTYEFTLVRFDGLSWVPFPCQDGSTPGGAAGVCGLEANQQSIAPGTTVPIIPDPLPRGLTPGWYALVYPTLTEIGNYPGWRAIGGAAVLISLRP